MLNFLNWSAVNFGCPFSEDIHLLLLRTGFLLDLRLISLTGLATSESRICMGPGSNSGPMAGVTSTLLTELFF